MTDNSNQSRSRDIAKEVASFRFCGPSDDPDEQTAVLYAFRALLTRFKRASRSLADDALRAEIENLKSPEMLYDAYDVAAEIRAMQPDLDAAIEGSGTVSAPRSIHDLRAFVSYATNDKTVAGRAKLLLEAYGIRAFLAHEDIEVSAEWESKLLDALNSCNVFVAILSKAFLASQWTSQEIGIAYSKPRMLFIPISVDGTTSFGFISGIQSKQLSGSNSVEQLILQSISCEFPRLVMPRMISRLASALSFREAEHLMLPLVPHFAELSNEEAEQFAVAATGNGQIWDARECRTNYLPAFLRLNRNKLSSKTRQALEYQVANGEWFRPT